MNFFISADRLHQIPCFICNSKFFNACLHDEKTVVADMAVALLDRQLFKAASQKKHLIRIFRREQRDRAAFVELIIHHPLHGKLLERVTDRSAAGSELLRDLCFH